MKNKNVLILVFIIVLPLMTAVYLLTLGRSGDKRTPPPAPERHMPEAVPKAVPANETPDPKQQEPAGEDTQKAQEEQRKKDELIAALTADANKAIEEKDIEKLIGILARIAELSPSDEMTEKIKFAQAALKAQKEAEEENQKKNFQMHYDAAENFRQASKWDDAVKEYNSAMQFAPQYKDLLNSKIQFCETKKSAIIAEIKELTAAANESMAAGKYLQALDAVEKILGYDSANKDALELKKKAYDEYLLKDMIFVPAGGFVFGPPDGTADVVIQDFYIDKYEVTNAQYMEYMLAVNALPPKTWPDGKMPEEFAGLPVTGVSWNDAAGYARWAHKRLPSETEWEKAARGTDGRAYPWGAEFNKDLCNTAEGGRSGVIAVDSFPGGAGPYGCLNMAGNVAEWTSTQYGDKPGETDTALRQFRVLRGGSFMYPADKAAVFARMLESPSIQLIGCGFRCAVTYSK